MAGKKKAPKKSPKPKEKDVRGRIIRSLRPEDAGHSSGHLEGADAMSAVPPDVLRDLKRALKSGKAKITIAEHEVGGDGYDVEIDIG
jgi:hypothetical protein